MNPVRSFPGAKPLIYLFLINVMVTISLASQAQAIGTWNFNGSTTGTPGSFNTVSTADFSLAVPTRAFNAGAEYYGHDGWPSGGIDANFYLSFVLSPNTGYALNILSLNLRMRHSNTGSSGGSGPKQFTIRSSLDGYTADIATGSITGAYSNFIFAPGAAFNNLPTPVTFRVYGHNAVMYSGGNNRFVFDNIQVDAIGIVLPLKLLSFTATAGIDNVALRYQVNDVEAKTNLFLERSTDNNTFITVASENETKFQVNKIYSYNDKQIPSNIGLLYYRLRIHKPDGKSEYTAIIPVKTIQSKKQLTVTYSRGMLKLEGLLPGDSKLSLYNSSGNLVYTTSLLSGKAVQTINALPLLPAGIYYLRTAGSSRSQGASFLY